MGFSLENSYWLKHFRYFAIKFPPWDIPFFVREMLFKREAMPLPKAIQLEPTTKCNFNCITCTRKSLPESRLNKDLSIQDFHLILDSIPSLRVIKLQGLGEPLMNPHIWKILEYGKMRGIKFSTITNGSLLNLNNIRNALKYLDSLCVSIDSTNPNTFEDIRSGAKYDDIVKNLKLMVEIKREIESTTDIGVNFVASHINYHEIPDLCSLAYELGLNFIYIVEVENWLTPNEKEYLSTSKFIREARKVSGEIRRLVLKSRRKHRKIPIYHRVSRRRKLKCSWCFDKCFINVKGYVTPCCNRKNPYVFNFGNIFEEQFNDVWNGEKMRKFRISMMKDKLNSICDQCPN